MTYPYQKICFTLVSDLQPRMKDIMVARFGLDEEKPQTLEEIGSDQDGITRERVRQIVEDGLGQLRDHIQGDQGRQKVEKVFRHFSDTFEELGDVKRQDLLVEALDARDALNHIIFLLTLGDQFYGQRETEDFYPFWAAKKEAFEGTPIALDHLVRHLEKENAAFSFDDLVRQYAERVREDQGAKIAPRAFPSVLEISKHIAQRYDGKWGLRKWPEVSPRGMRDKSYVVLKKTGKPLHFVQVAELIDQLQSEGVLRGQKERKVLPQTVHNELIKDPRFVLVGRGMYALAEWGYAPGTVKDIIAKVLKGNGGSMEREEVVQKTLEQRYVKRSTVLLNLSDKALFLKDADGRYSIPHR